MVLSSREAAKILRAEARSDEAREAVETLITENLQLRSLANRVIDAAVTRWHDPDKDLELIDWLEMSAYEYDEWIQKIGIFSPDAVPYRLDDDEAILRGYNAIKQMHIMRIGALKDHAQAFRDALIEDDD